MMYERYADVDNYRGITSAVLAKKVFELGEAETLSVLASWDEEIGKWEIVNLAVHGIFGDKLLSASDIETRRGPIKMFSSLDALYREVCRIGDGRACSIHFDDAW